MKKHKIVLVLVMIGLIAAVILFTCTKVKSNRIDKQFQDAKYISYTVKAGDTLWDIAQEHNKFDVSTQEYISRIFKINNLHSDMIRDGSSLILVIPNE